MEYRNLGRSGLKVSALSLGTNAFGGRADEATAIAVVHAALDQGINLIDTADIYTQGESERCIGKALKGRRSQAVLATKCCGRMGPGPNDLGASRKHILDAVHASLERLQTDYIDLYQMHVWDESTPIEETMSTLNDLVRQGKVRYIGCSNYAAWQMVQAVSRADARGWTRFVANQPEYSPINRKIEREIIPAGLAEGIGQIVYFPLAAGLFTGKYKPGQPVPEGSRAAKAGDGFVNRWLTAANFAVMADLTALADEVGVSLPHLVLSWVMAKPGVTSAIVGASRPEQVMENLGACSVVLSTEVMKRIDDLTAGYLA